MQGCLCRAGLHTGPGSCCLGQSPAATHVCRASVAHSRPGPENLHSARESKGRSHSTAFLTPLSLHSLIQRLPTSRLSSGPHHTHHSWRLQQQKFLSSGSWEPKIKGLAGLVSGETSLSGLSTATFSVTSVQGESSWRLFLLSWPQCCQIRAPYGLTPPALPLLVTGVRASTQNCGETVHNKRRR